MSLQHRASEKAGFAVADALLEGGSPIAAHVAETLFGTTTTAATVAVP